MCRWQDEENDRLSDIHDGIWNVAYAFYFESPDWTYYVTFAFVCCLYTLL